MDGLEGEIPLIILKEIEVNSHIAGFHVYKTVWEPYVGEQLHAGMESTNAADKYAVCVKKENNIVGHIAKGLSGRFAKRIFYFMRAGDFATCDVFVTGKAVNLGDKKGQKSAMHDKSYRSERNY